MFASCLSVSSNIRSIVLNSYSIACLYGLRNHRLFIYYTNVYGTVTLQTTSTCSTTHTQRNIITKGLIANVISDTKSAEMYASKVPI